jgi:hypothetical protein
VNGRHTPPRRLPSTIKARRFGAQTQPHRERECPRGKKKKVTHQQLGPTLPPLMKNVRGDLYGKCYWHMVTSDPSTSRFLKILKPNTFMFSKIMPLNI